ncbi:MAG: CvpA family protein [Clostridia bacterium]|nr:CvpA family protein [Clostridia bacterium]
MNIVIDVILGLLALLIIVQHTVKGFVQSMLGALKLVMAVVATYFLTPIFFTPSDVQSKIVAYLLVFSASYIILTALVYVIDKLCHLPILHAANKLLGFVLGVICAYISLCFASAVLTALLNLAAEDLFGKTADEICNSTYIYKFFKYLDFFPVIGK